MKIMFEELPSPDISKGGLSSESSRDVDQEMGPNSMSTPRKQNSILARITNGLELDPLRMVLGEAVGTFILMFCVCGITAITKITRGEVGLLEYAATGGLTVVVIVFTIGPISGAHVNPAFTIAFAISGQFPWAKVPYYILAQISGSLLATVVGKYVYGVSAELMTTRPIHGGCTSAFWVELIATLIVMFLASSLTYYVKHVGHLAGLVMGVGLGLAVLITGPISGGSLNPARSLGPAIVSWKFDDIWIYVAAPTIGASFGAFLFSFLRLRNGPCFVFICDSNSSSTLS